MSINLPVIVHLGIESVCTSGCFKTCIYKTEFLKTSWWNLNCRIVLRVYINSLDTYKAKEWGIKKPS